MSNGCGSRPALPTVIARPRYARHATLPARMRPPTESTTRSTPRPPVIARTSSTQPSLRVVHAVVHAQRHEPLEPVGARRGRDHRRARTLRELDRGDADATRTRLHEHRLARLQVAELEQAVVGGAERDRHARDRDEIGAVGHRPGDDRGHGHALGVRSPEVGAHDALTDLAIGHALADLDDRARALVADDVRHRRHLAAGAVERVAALDADRLDLR